jgi:hypothetical protein
MAATRLLSLRLALLCAALLGTSCFITTDENLWKQRKEAGPDTGIADAFVETDGDQGPRPDGVPDKAVTDGPAVDRPLTDGKPPDGKLPDTVPPDTTPWPDKQPSPDTGKLPNGSTCSTGSVCSTGNCKDGVCCNSACAGPCEACNLSGNKGICSPTPAGTDPDGDCKQDPVSTCGLDGTCNGSGGCRKYPVGTVCATMTCSGADSWIEKKCDSLGACTGTAVSCVPYKCDNTTGACYITCTSDAQCSLYRCNTAVSKCYSSCTTGAQCQSGKCIGGGKCK